MENLMNEGKKITLNGKEVTLRRLGIKDIFKFTKILKKLGSGVLQDLKGIDPNEDAKQFGFLIVSSIGEAEEEVIEFLSSLVGMEKTEFENLPPDNLFTIGEALAESEDLKAFLEKAKGLLKVQNKTQQTNNG